MPIDAVLIGAGGFGREALDVLEAANRLNGRETSDYIRVVGYVDDAPTRLNTARLLERGYNFMGTVETLLSEWTPGKYILGIGSPITREQIAARLGANGWEALTLVHPNASIGTRVSIGKGSIICGGVQLSTNTRLGEHVHINPNATIGHDTFLEDFVSVNPGAIVSGEVQIGRASLIGAGAVVLQQLTVGSEAVIGAAACVVKNVTAGRTVVGVPAHELD